jgi:hypothetical protein
MEIRKTTTVRFYDYAGTFIGIYKDATVGSFRKIINGGLGDLTIDLAMTFAQAYESQYTVLFNRVEVVVTDAETPPGGVIIYSGFVFERYPTMDGSEQKVVLTCRGHAARFAYLPLKASTTTVVVTDTTNGLNVTNPTAATLNKVLSHIIALYRQESVHPIINTTATSVETTTRTWTYRLKTKTIQYAIEKLMENAPAGAYWRVGADNIFYYRQRSTTPDHILTLGAHITAIQDRQTLDGLVNRFHFSYNGAPPGQAKVYQDTPSSSIYGDWWAFKVDGRYSVQGEVDNVGTSAIAARKTPPRRTIITVADNNGDRNIGYDIERFEPGDTLSILNLPLAAQQNFPAMFQIVAVQYSLGQAVLELDTPDDDLAREFAKAEREEQGDDTENVPNTYTI